MKQVGAVTARQDPDEPELGINIYRSGVNFYVRIESNHPAIPESMPFRINVSNFKDAKVNAEKLLYIVRRMFREILGKSPGLPEHLKEIEQANACIRAIFAN
jgi:hypothetical protein